MVLGMGLVEVAGHRCARCGLWVLGMGLVEVGGLRFHGKGIIVYAREMMISRSWEHTSIKTTEQLVFREYLDLFRELTQFGIGDLFVIKVYKLNLHSINKLIFEKVTNRRVEDEELDEEEVEESTEEMDEPDVEINQEVKEEITNYYISRRCCF